MVVRLFPHLPVVLVTISPFVVLYSTQTVSSPSSSPAPITKTLGCSLAMALGITSTISVHVDPSPSHTPHASSTLPLYSTLSHPMQVELVPLHTPLGSWKFNLTSLYSLTSKMVNKKAFFSLRKRMARFYTVNSFQFFTQMLKAISPFGIQMYGETKR